LCTQVGSEVIIRLALDQGSLYRFEKRSDLLHIRHFMSISQNLSFSIAMLKVACLATSFYFYQTLK
jgi:hypothetical protein